ncbi:hypothetical protein BaRGS_00018997, partial [Batillaria attramentaria]
MEESSLQQSLDLYRAQLAQIDQAVAAAGETEELRRLQSDLQELINLTEGSLLSLKKSQLLKSLEDAENATSTASGGGTTSVDDEYAAFQAALDDASEKQPLPSDQSTPSASGDNCSSAQLTSLPYTVKNSQELSNLTGMKCRAPFSHDWGKLDYHNALVMSAERETDTDQILVKVMFTTPTHVSMLPCKFYLDGRCRFSDDQCRYSHGYTVQLEKLREYVEADHSTVAVGKKCLAQYTDSVWYPATVTDVKEETVSVHFDDFGVNLITVFFVHDESDSDSEDEKDGPQASTSAQGKSLVPDSEEEEEELPVFLWKPPQTTAAMGEWEAHTRGIGSKLMSKMGYIPGQGLGSSGQGKAEPVPILLLPQ